MPITRNSLLFVAVVMCGMFSTSAHCQQGQPAVYEPTIQCVNLDLNDTADLHHSAEKLGFALKNTTAIEANNPASTVIWEARESTDLDVDQATKLGEYVRKGGNLILTLDARPGKGPFRLSYMLPTTAWRTTMFHGLEFARSAHGAQWDPVMFPQPPTDTLSVPYFFEMRPFDTVERGQGRHEPLEQLSVVLSGGKFGGDYKPWDPVFTRSLINREWQVRVRTDALQASGLLITGRYGAGSVAVFASSARYMTGGVWLPLLQWMKQNQSGARSPALTDDQITSIVTVDAAHRTVNVELTNHQSNALRAMLVARILTWENALIGDSNQLVQLPPNATVQVTLAMPTVDASSYQALQFRDAYIVRSGVLSEDGRQIVCQQRTGVDFRPPQRVEVMLDNVRGMPYPFKAPGYSGLAQFNDRMGEPVMSYAYPPGAAVSGVVRVSNGLSNIGLLAKVTDETQPENPSASAINDDNVSVEKGPREDMHAYGWWVGKADIDNSLLFTFPESVTVNQVIINGNPDTFRQRNRKNPAEVIVETDSGQVADVKGLDAAFASGLGLVHVPSASAKTQHVRVRFPWMAKVDGGQNRNAPSLGEIQIIGCRGVLPPAANGKLTVALVDAMHQTQTILARQDLRLDPAKAQEIPIHFTTAKLAMDSGEGGFYRVEADFTPEGGTAAAEDSAPLMVIQPKHPLKSLDELRPPGHVNIGFIVSLGFRNIFNLGTGTREVNSGWETPDDLVWAYEHQLKQTSKTEKKSAGHLFVNEADFRHYVAPWSIYPNGEVFFTVAAPNLVAKARTNANWKQTDTVALGFGDRWDTGPSGNNLYAWQELAAFDEYLFSQHLPRLTGKTRQQLTREIIQKYTSRWSAWQMARYAQSVRTLREAFAKEGKRLVISAQGMPLVPLKYLNDLAQTIAGFSDDSTWGMWGENIPVTTGRTMALLAFNPDWRLSEVLVPGYDSAGISTRFWAVVGTTESTRRHFFDPGWRGLITTDGTYRCMNTYGFNMNGSSGYCMNLNDWQEMWRLEERLSLLSPEAPIGAGVIVSNAAWDDPDRTTYSGGGMGDSEGDEKIRDAAKAIGALSEVGIPVSFSSNITALGKWTGNAPLILLDLSQVSDSEVSVLAQLKKRGDRMVAFAGVGKIPAAGADLFGVNPDGSPSTGKTVAGFNGGPVVQGDHTLLIHGASDNLDTAALQTLLHEINNTLDVSLKLPDGMTGYGFTMGKQKYLVMEDWVEHGRVATVRLHADSSAQNMMGVNVDDHQPVDVKRDGDDWVIRFTTRPGDGTLLCLQPQ